MKIFFLILALAVCARSEENKKETPNKDKRQTEEGAQIVYRTARKQEQVAPVQENQEDDKQGLRNVPEEYRPGQVFSLNVQELLELQPERKAPLQGNQQLQQLFNNNPQQDHRQNSQQFFYLEPQLSRQVAFQPSHAVIARPHYSSNGGEASVGAALAVSDSAAGSVEALDHELLALLGHQGRQDDTRAQSYVQTHQTPQLQTQSVAPQYQQVDVPYVQKPSKKPTKLRPKTQLIQPQASTAPQQYLIETTNVQNQHQQLQQHLRPIVQTQRVPQTLRYVSIQPAQTAVQQTLYERPESQGLKVVPPPKLQQLNPQYNYRIQYQPEAPPKQYRIIESPRAQSVRQEQPRVLTNERPVAYLKRFPDPEKQRAVPEQNLHESLLQRPTQLSDQYYLRPIYRSNDRPRYELAPAAHRPTEQARSLEPVKTPLSAIYVSKNVAPKKVLRPALRVEQASKQDQPLREQHYRAEHQSSTEHISVNQHAQSIEEQRARLPPPKNNKAYTQEEFAALVAAGYSVTPVPVGQLTSQVAQSRSSVEPIIIQPRRPYNRRQYLPFRGDDAP